MIAGQRAFLEKYTALWSERAEARRSTGSPADAQIAKTLDSIVGKMLADLAAAPPEPEHAPEPAPISYVGDPDKITWKAPVFNVGGRFNPFAGTKREGWLASADACDRLKCPDAAATLRQMAADVDPDEMPDTHPNAAPPVGSRAALKPAPKRRSVWDGPPMPPPEPTPFIAGEQIGFAL